MGSQLEDFLECNRIFPLYSIQNDEQLAEYCAQLDRLDAPEEGDNSGLAQYFNTLSDLIELYEHHNVKVKKPTPSQLLRHLVDMNNLTIPRLATETGIAASTLHTIMKRCGRVSPKARKILAAYFGVEEELFCLSQENGVSEAKLPTAVQDYFRKWKIFPISKVIKRGPTYLVFIDFRTESYFLASPNGKGWKIEQRYQ